MFTSQRIMFTKMLFWFPLFFQANTKFFLAEVEGLEKGTQKIPAQTLPLLVENQNTPKKELQKIPVQTSPLLVKNEDEEDTLIADESDGFGTKDRKPKKVDKGTESEHGSDYNDYGSMFFGGIYLTRYIY